MELKRITNRMLPEGYDTIGACKSPNFFLILKKDLAVSKGNALEQSAAERLSKSGDDRLVMIYEVININSNIGIVN